jgi:hypothetical protein
MKLYQVHGEYWVLVATGAAYQQALRLLKDTSVSEDEMHPQIQMNSDDDTAKEQDDGKGGGEYEELDAAIELRVRHTTLGLDRAFKFIHKKIGRHSNGTSFVQVRESPCVCHASLTLTVRCFFPILRRTACVFRVLCCCRIPSCTTQARSDL